MVERPYYCDFHVHSCVSDGACTREEIVKRAIKENEGKKIVLAISDHNKVFDDLEVLQEKYKNEIKLITGCEVSVNYVVPETGKNMEIHILALDYDKNALEFREMLQKNQHDKKIYIETILEKMEAIGIHVASDYEEVRNFVAESNHKSDHIGRMALARMMVAKGICSNIDECFDLYFGSYGKRQCYVPFPYTYVGMEEAISTIKKAGGIPILCHPYYYKLKDEQLTELVHFFKEKGGLALECFYGAYSATQREELMDVCKSTGLYPSAGSDFHGNPGEHLHHHFPGWIYDDLMKLKGQAD